MLKSSPALIHLHGKRCLVFSHFQVIEESKTFYGVYAKNNSNRLVTHRKSWRSATRVAKLLEEAFWEGYRLAEEDARGYYF